MDLVLEFSDKYIFDYIYATLLPLDAAPRFHPNGTFSSIRVSPTTYPVSTWEFKPASQFLQFQPSQYAYMSQWNRDYWIRQFVSFFFITWYVNIQLPRQAPPTCRYKC